VSRRPIQHLLKRASTKDCVSKTQLRQFRRPVLLVWGQQERLFKEHQFRWWLEHTPAHLLEAVRPEGVGHMAPLDSPDLISDVVVDFVRRRCQGDDAAGASSSKLRARLPKLDLRRPSVQRLFALGALAYVLLRSMA